MTRHTAHTPKSRILLEQVWREVGGNRLEERWIQDTHGWLGYQETGKVVISPMNMIPTLLHELLHAARPRLTERGIDRLTTVLWRSMSDAECMRLWDGYNAKVVRISKPATSKDDG
jgi:hypothetical protein